MLCGSEAARPPYCSIPITSAILNGRLSIFAAIKYRYRDVHKCTMKLVELIPDDRIVWLVTDNYFNFTEDKNE